MEELHEAKRKRRIRNLFKIAESMSYDGIELHISNPHTIGGSFLKELSATHGLDVPAVGTGPTYVLQGISFLGTPHVRRKAVDRLQKYVEVARDLGSIVIVGLIRGRLDGGFSRPKAWQMIRECLKRSAKVAEDYEVTLAIEPINRYETEIINTMAEADRMASEVDSESVKIMADTFHMNIEEASITDSLQRFGRSLVHFHVADSNRMAPGRGHLDFASIISGLKEVGYDRYVSAEILPKPSVREAFRDTIRYLKPMLLVKH